MSLAEISARIAQIQSLTAARPATVSRFAAPSFDATLASLSPTTGTSSLDTLSPGTAATAGLGIASSTAAPTSAAADGDDIAAWAARYVGVPYVAGGRSPTGWDCAGFTQWVAQQFGVSIPEVSWQQIKQGTPVAGLSSARPGDLLFFHEPGGHRRDPSALKVNHVAIYLGDGRMVEAANPRAGTRVGAVDVDHLVGIRRIAPTGDGVARAPGAVAVASLSRTASLSAAAPVAGATGELAPTQLVDVLRRAGFSGEGLRTAWALAMRESHGRPGAVGAPNPNGTRDHGLFQINDIHVGRSIAADQLYDASANAAAAFRMSDGGTDFSAWGLGHSSWAGHLEAQQPAFYAKVNAAWRAWYDRFPAA